MCFRVLYSTPGLYLADTSSTVTATKIKNISRHHQMFGQNLPKLRTTELMLIHRTTSSTAKTFCQPAQWSQCLVLSDVSPWADNPSKASKFDLFISSMLSSTIIIRLITSPWEWSLPKLFQHQDLKSVSQAPVLVFSSPLTAPELVCSGFRVLHSRASQYSLIKKPLGPPQFKLPLNWD